MGMGIRWVLFRWGWGCGGDGNGDGDCWDGFGER